MSDERKDGPFTRTIGAVIILVAVLACAVACAWILVLTW